MRVDLCKFDTQAQPLQPQRGVLDLAHQVRQRAFVYRAGVGPLQLLARKQVLAESVQQCVQLMPRQAQLLMPGKTVEILDLSVSDVAVGDYRQRDDAGRSLRAVRGITAHAVSPLGAVDRSVEDVAQPGFLAVGWLMTSAVSAQLGHFMVSSSLGFMASSRQTWKGWAGSWTD